MKITDLIKGVKLTVKSTTSAAEKITGAYDATMAQAAMQIMVDQINHRYDAPRSVQTRQCR